MTIPAQTTPPPIVVAVAGCRAAIRSDDAVFARGDGVFETTLVRSGIVCRLEEHLARLAASAALALASMSPPGSERLWLRSVAATLHPEYAALQRGE